MGTRSKERLEMGEEAWAKHKKALRVKRSQNYRLRNPDACNNYKRNTKKKLIEYKGGKCEICGYNKPIPGAYDFHHKDPTQKDFTISESSKNFEAKKVEADKCQLLCRNCHAEIHENLISRRSKIG